MVSNFLRCGISSLLFMCSLITKLSPNIVNLYLLISCIAHYPHNYNTLFAPNKIMLVHQNNYLKQ